MLYRWYDPHVHEQGAGMLAVFGMWVGKTNGIDPGSAGALTHHPSHAVGTLATPVPVRRYW